MSNSNAFVRARMNVNPFSAPAPAPARREVKCACGFALFDGEVIRARVVRVLSQGAEAKCSRCKRWITVPLRYEPLAP